MIQAQFQAVAETRTSAISRSIMIDLEKRLERKEKCRGFETFLVGIILLNCTERMCWALKSLDEKVQNSEVIVDRLRYR